MVDDDAAEVVDPRARVCPDCGGPAGAQPFCANCGRNLTTVDRLPTQAEWEKQDAPTAASLESAQLEDKALAANVAKALSSLRSWMVPLDQPDLQAVDDVTIRDRIELSIEDHVAEALNGAGLGALNVEVDSSTGEQGTIFLAGSVSLPRDKSVERHFVAKVQRGRSQAQVQPSGAINLVGADGEFIGPLFAYEQARMDAAPIATISREPEPAGAVSASKNGLIIALVGLGAVAVGSIGPWATALLASFSGTQGDGKITLAVAAVAAVVLLISSGGWKLALPLSLVALGVSIYDLIHVSQKASQVTFAGVQVAHVGWGLYVCAGGALIALIGCIVRSNSLP